MAQRRRNALVSLLSLVLSTILTGWLPVPANSAESVSSGQIRGGRIEGIALSADSGTPLAGVTVHLMPQPEKTTWGPARITRTDKSGNFVFDQLSRGLYRLSIGLEGYITRLYPDSQDGEQSNYLEVEEGKVISGIRIDVHPGGMLSGTVSDEKGTAVPGATVKVLAPREFGEPYVVVAEAQTDQSGRYHFEKISPKRYWLRAQRAIEGDPANQSIEMGYYPNAPSPDSATLITVGPASAPRELDITVGHRVRAATIAGVVTDRVTGEPLEGVGVSAEERWRSFLTAKSAADGSYRLEGLLPGRYLLKTAGEKVGGGYIMEVKEVSVAGDYVMNIALTPAPLIIATVQYVGQGPHPAFNEYTVTLEFNCGNCQTHTNSPYLGKEVFEFRGLAIVPVRIGAGFATPRYRVARVLMGSEDITGKWINLAPGEKLTNVRILITDQQGLEPKTSNRSPGGAAK